MIRVLIADDHPMFRDGLAVMLNGLGDVEVVATASTGRQAVAAAAEHQPDVAVIDLRMPDGDGIAATASIRRACPATRILILTSFDGPEEVAAALGAGAHGYLVKSADPGEIAQAVRAVAAGSGVLTDEVLTALAGRSAAQAHSSLPELTEREAAVLVALARGLSTDEAATALGLSPKTVRNYVAAITVKLGVRDRTAAIVVARERGVLDEPRR